MKILRMICISLSEPVKVVLRIGVFFATVLGIFIFLKLLIFLLPGEFSGNVRDLNALIFIVSFLIAVPLICWIMDIRKALQIAEEKKIPLEDAWKEVRIEKIRNNLY